MIELLLMAAATVTWDFPGGNVGEMEWVAENRVRVGVPGQSDQDGRNRQASWYSFQLDGVEGREIEIVLTDLVGEYNYKKGTHPVRETTRPVFSYDRKTWTHFSETEWDEEAVELTVRFTPAEDVVWVAHTPPYTPEDLENLAEDVGGHPHLRREVVGETAGGLGMPLWTIADPAGGDDRPVVWLMFRQHAWESATSWACEGAMRWLLGGSADAAKLRREFVWKVYPMADPDGAATGGVRFNRNGYDLNRNWDAMDAKLMPEIYAQRGAIAQWLESGSRIDFFLTVHNTESSEYVEGPGEHRDLVGRFRSAMTRETSFEETREEPRDMLESTTVGLKGRMSVNQGLYADFGIPAMLMETRVERHPELGRPRVVEDWLELGAGLVRAAAETVSER